MVEIVLPVLSGVTSVLGAGVLGYRARRKARKARAFAKARIDGLREARETREQVVAVYNKAKEIYAEMTKDVDREKVRETLEKLMEDYKKDGRTKVTKPPVKAAE